MSLLELPVLDFLQGLRLPALDLFFSLFTRLGDSGLLFVALTAALLIFKKTRTLGLVCATALLLDLLTVNLIIKPIVARVRPFDLNPAVALLVPRPDDFSFPSGHSAVAFAFASALGRIGRGWRTAAYIFAALMAFSRLYLYLHYPTDVLCGAAAGWLCGLAARKIWKRRLDAA